jgi:uncharacterized protein YjbJ (UPF0337 family)
MEKQQSGTDKKEQCTCTGNCHTNTEDTMKSGIRDKAEGTFHEVKGKIMEVAGKLSDNPKLRAEGTVEKLGGRLQEKIGQVKQVFGK